MSALKLCPTCGTEYPANERFCPRDGTALRAQGGGTDLVGSIIADRYHVIRKLGEGGMGQVYLAEHVKMGRKSAVKVMNPGMVQDADAISRFNREASNASRINHQHVAGIYDFGETAEGLIYLAMEYVEGEPLTDLLKRAGALPPHRAAELTRQTGEALAVAHDMGIVHRDLKPDNIMITQARDGADCVKVVDFGIAKAANVEAQKVTRTGLAVGTPEYMSPEQLAGDPLDGRSDVYSLGLVAFNMLTGHLPFPSETVQESMIMRLTDRPKRLDEMRPETRWSDAVQQVMDHALERDASARFGSASDFGRALVDAVKSMPSVAAAASAPASVSAPASAAQTSAAQTSAAPVPQTRVSEPMPPALRGSTAAPMRQSRLPMQIGAAVAVLAVAGAGAMFMSRTPANASGVQRDSTSVPTSLASEAAPAVSGGGHTAPVPTPIPAATSTSGSNVRTALPSSASSPAASALALSRSVANDETPRVTGAPGGTSYGAELVKLDDSINDSLSARSAEQSLASWRPRVTLASDSAAIQFITAHVAMFTSAARGCALMHRVKPELLGESLKKSFRDAIDACN